MMKENWNISYAKLATEHKWGGVINSFLALMGFCYLFNGISNHYFDGKFLLGSIEEQALLIAVLTIIHTLSLPAILRLSKVQSK